MDADTRHQLKQNELAEAINRLRDWDDPRLRWGLVVLAVLALAVIGWFSWQASVEYALEQDWQRLADIAMAMEADEQGAEDDLRALIADASSPVLAGYARLRLASARVNEAMEDPSVRQQALTEAEDELDKVVNNHGGSPMLAASAMFALASVKESLGDMSGARALYESLGESSEYAGSPYQSLAEARLEDMGALETEIAFAPGAPPEPEAGTTAQPQTPRFGTPEEIDDPKIREMIRKLQQNPNAAVPVPQGPAPEAGNKTPPPADESGQTESPEGTSAPPTGEQPEPVDPSTPEPSEPAPAEPEQPST